MRRAEPRRSPRRLLVVLPLAAVLSGALLSGAALGAAPAGAGVAVSTMPTAAAQGDVTDPDPGPVDPAEVREDVREVMGRDEFSYEPSLVERVMDWIGEQLDKLFPDSEPTQTGGNFTGGIGGLVAWLLIVVAVVAVVAAIVYVVVRRIRTPESIEEEPTETEVEHRRAAAAWRSDALDHEAAGEWKQAIRARYRLLVRTLTDRGQLPEVPGRTTGELREDLARTTPTAGDDFDTASLLFELPWYADVATGPDENARFRAAAEAVLAAPVQDSYDELDPTVTMLRGDDPPEGRDLVEVEA